MDGFDASSDGKLLVDVAGGRGHDIDAFRRKFPDISTPGRLVVEDLPQVIGDIHDLDSFIERVGFDLFDSQPVKGALSFPFLHSISNPYLTCMHAPCRCPRILPQIHPPRLERQRLPQDPAAPGIRHEKGL